MTQVSILHLSDVHYKSPASNFANDNKADVPAAMQVSVFRNLHQILEHAFEKEHFAAIAVSGDITTHGQAEGFNLFQKQTYGLLRRLVAEHRAICMVPGNHDVVWDIPPDKVDYFDRKFKAFRLCVETTEATSCLIPTGRIPATDEANLEFLTPGHRSAHIWGPLYINRRQRLIVACLNSSLRCGEVNQKLRSKLRKPIETACQKLASAKASMKGARRIEKLVDEARQALLEELLPEIDRHSLFDIPHITQAQMNLLGSAIMKARAALSKEGEQWRDYIKVATLHHHLVPFSCQVPEYKAFEVAADAASVLDLLAGHGFQVILTGHKHQRYEQEVRFGKSELMVIGGLTVGGFPVTGHGQGIQYIQLEQDKETIKIRIAGLSCDIQGDIRQKVKDRLRQSSETILTLPTAGEEMHTRRGQSRSNSRSAKH
jgi:3',5'-cyclic AMP phosphodiesterase CpdA